ncbi:Gram-negative bacterial tonB protein [Enhygromyxa salina]|uniref:Gram-negative bacterial tonB protein n=1 Tax=Enhygromyxa salina TaxID=215803 RepID=A0A2S9XEP6_9BACT|nr:Gram-negative bacterial tonB protein [Enhygromyxa salina]
MPKLVCPALGEGETGAVSLRVEVDASGRVSAVAVLDGLDPACDALAVDALVHAEFEPARSPAGEPIDASLTFVYRFGVDRFEVEDHDDD